MDIIPADKRGKRTQIKKQIKKDKNILKNKIEDKMQLQIQDRILYFYY